MRELCFHVSPLKDQIDRYVDGLAERGMTWLSADGAPWRTMPDRRRVERLAALLDQHGMRVSSHHYDGPNMCPVGEDQSPAIREMAFVIDAAAIWRPRTLVIHWGWYANGPAGGPGWLEHFIDNLTRDEARHGLDALIQVQAENLRAVAPLAARHGMRLALENLLPPWPTGGSWEHIVRVIEAVDEPNVGLCLDSGHAHCSGQDVAAAVRRAGATLFETHFHDNLGPVGEPGPQGFGDMHLPLGLGTIDWLGVAAAIDEINYAGPITFEGQYRFFGDTPEGFFRGVDVSMANWRAVEDLAAR